MTTDAQFWNKASANYAKSPIKDMESYHYTLGRTRSYLGAQDRVLELGCGTGSTALELAPSVSHVTATDFSQGMLAYGRTRAAEQGVANVTFQPTSVGNDGLGDATFDAVMGFNLFHLVKDIDGAFADIHARLKPGGLFISKTPCLGEPGLGVKLALLLRLIPLMQLVGKAPFVAMLSVNVLERALTRAGFEIIETGNFPAKPVSRYIVARRV